MPKPTFLNGQVLDETILTKMDNMQFVAVPNDYGQRGLIKDNELDTDTNSLLSRFNRQANELTVTAGSGLGFNYVGGRVTDSKNITTIFASGSGVVPANATSFVYITDSLKVGAYLPQECLPLAQVTANGVAITSVINLRPDHPIIVQPRTINRDGGNGRDGDLNFSAGDTSLDGIRNYKSVNFTGGTIYVSPGFTEWRVQGDAYLNGTIIVRPFVLGSKGIQGFIVPGVIVPGAASGLGAGAGHNIPPAQVYGLDTSLFGSGGCAGLVHFPGTITGALLQSQGGDGGGGFRMIVVGNITFGPNFRLFVEGGDATNAVLYNGGNGGSFLIGAAGGGSGGGADFTCYGLMSIGAGGAQISVRGGNGGQGAMYGPSVGVDTCVAGGGFGGGGRVRFRAAAYSFNTVTQVAIRNTPDYITPWSNQTIPIGSGSIPYPWYASGNQAAPPTPPTYVRDTGKLNINISNGFNGLSLYSQVASVVTPIGYGVNGLLTITGQIALNANNGGALNNSNLAKTVGIFAGSSGGSFGGSGALLSSNAPSPTTIVQFIASNTNAYGTVEFLTLN